MYKYSFVILQIKNENLLMADIFHFFGQYNIR